MFVYMHGCHNPTLVDQHCLHRVHAIVLLSLSSDSLHRGQVVVILGSLSCESLDRWFDICSHLYHLDQILIFTFTMIIFMDADHSTKSNHDQLSHEVRNHR